jgi:hypothetical protein
MAWAYLERAAADNVVHTEMFFDPQTHTARGVAMETVINGLHRACVDAQAEAGRERLADPVLPAPPERGRRLRNAGAGAAVSRQVHRRRPRFERGRPPAREVRARVRALPRTGPAPGRACRRRGPAGIRVERARRAEGRARRPRRAERERPGADAAAGAGPHSADGVPAVQPQAVRVPRPGAAQPAARCSTPAWSPPSTPTTRPTSAAT